MALDTDLNGGGIDNNNVRHLRQANKHDDARDNTPSADATGGEESLYERVLAPKSCVNVDGGSCSGGATCCDTLTCVGSGSTKTCQANGTSVSVVCWYREGEAAALYRHITFLHSQI